MFSLKYLQLVQNMRFPVEIVAIGSDHAHSYRNKCNWLRLCTIESKNFEVGSDNMHFRKNNSDATKSGTGHTLPLFFVFEVVAGGEAMGALHRGARTHSRTH